ncbi:MAG: hypothetical protein UV19_C0016G0007 [Parcubacteria group bacterium GW2011_GWA2_42_28]|nr:MAG: hypothetical protein UV19_C0016G0007 [Parcubacteria group bacterium GW2011_GWA2_42_28]
MGFLGFLGVGPILRGDWPGALWLLWFLWFLYFVRASPHPSPKAADGHSNVLNDARTEARKDAVEKVFAEIQRKGTIRNDDVQALLGARLQVPMPTPSAHTPSEPFEVNGVGHFFCVRIRPCQIQKYRESL